MTITRFAPSPTGELHLGHAHSALFAFAAAKAAGGRFLLRIEDIDRTRCRPEFTQGIFTDLGWLGLDWERPVRVQSEHFDEYRAALDRLEGMGLLYPCFCTRKDIAREVEGAGHAPHGPDGPLYPGHCRHLSVAERRERREAGQAFALRLDVAAAAARVGPLAWHDRAQGEQTAQPELFGDVVLARKDIPASYHLAVTVDDALQGVTLVTRGQDLFEATHVHRLLQALLGLPVPGYLHHRLLTDPSGRRYAKRDRSLTLRALREAGRTPDEVRSLAGF
ncbi:tRNA glutamyl-Q(34) synthetase GluQRS [Paramagnetospirillum magneticum]|uniref:Glutamyl-and glutaminyl-tRNA synthetase n=1 Tax=Paramagnetospirillum magneticum (strain ATCC 700264 / AMB-1) TaxID=342108 RepID=Q2VZ59_PARM1|nr:tRNA glutamyl-Q(34) synthetase GluQRS [Paramagnetospirillum magneticum]BAE53116.1 Glutamyl- and glutaminyl-tRNA synthetase [Paramagnetospirillum magneticum AMB-1]